MLGLIFLLVVIVCVLAYQLFQKRKQLKRYQGIIDLEAEQQKIQKENQDLVAETEKFKNEGRTVRDAVTALRSQLANLEDAQEMAEHGLYEPKYDFGSSTRFKAEIENLRQKQKQMISDKIAILWKTEWTVEGSKA